jgi:hypothetical protein
MRWVDWGYELKCEPIATATGRTGLRTRFGGEFVGQTLDLPALKRNEGAGKGSRYR